MIHFRRSQPTAVRPPRRAGYLYVAVLFTTLIIVATVTAGLSLSTANTRGEIDRIDRMSALRLAESQLQRVATQMQSENTWRSTATNSVYSDWIALGTRVNGTDYGVVSSDPASAYVRHRFVDADGDLADDASDTVTLTAHASVGRSQAGVSVQLIPRFDPLPLLYYGVTTANDLIFANGGSLTTQWPVQVGGDCLTSTSGVLTTPRLECSNAVQMTLRGELANAAVTAPPQDVIAEYTQGGTSIPVGSLPLVGGARQLSDRLLTAADNPFGTPDMDGHYKIDALGQAIRIGNCRIEGTLVIIDTPLIILTNGITWNCAGDPNAILVTDGTIRLEDVEPTLNESNISVNMNPVTSPYRGTESNNTTGDVYPTELRGVLYTTDDIEIGPLTDGSQLRIEGVMVSNNLTITGNVAIQNFDGILQTPPVPLADWIPMEFVRGTFRRVNVP